DASEVGEGKIEATVADSNIVQMEQTYSATSPSGPTDRILLLDRLDDAAKPERAKRRAHDFMKKLYKSTFYNIMVNKYFKNFKGGRSDQKLRADRGGQLSPYVALVKKHARTYEMDWRLITAQMYQESGFNPKATSWVGAKGLMQVMPRTAQELRIGN